MGNTLTRALGTVGLFGKQHLPEILTGVSAACTVGSIIFAIKSTRQVDIILDKHKEDLAALNDVHNNPDEYLKEGETYTEDDYKKDLAITYTKTGIQLIKLYSPTIILGVAAIACGFASCGILKGRNAALTATVAGLSTGWKEYRERVREKVGDEIERQLYTGETVEEEIEVVEGKNGKDKNVVHKKFTYNPLSPYAQVFDDRSPNWNSEHLDLNYFFVKKARDYFNDKLQARGYLTLAEVYEYFGFDVTAEALCVGWIYDKRCNNEGDNYVDFGLDKNPIYNLDDEEWLDHNSCIYLDFNVDGPILDRMPSNNRNRNRD